MPPTAKLLSPALVVCSNHAVRPGPDSSDPESPPASSSDRSLLRRIPKVDQILQQAAVASWIERTSRGFVVEEVQRLLGEVRAGIRSGDPRWKQGVELEDVGALLDDRLARRLRPVL